MSDRSKAISLVLFFATLAAATPFLRAAANRQNAAAPQSQTDEAAPAKPENSAAIPKGIRLYLTDGTFQVVREYQRVDDRVRYYSVERSGWEEIPASLVDFAATEKSQAQQAAEQQHLVDKIKSADLAARIANIDVDKSFEVSPGVILPDTVGLYAVADGKFYPLQQTLGVSHIGKGREFERIASGVPIIPQKHNLEIPGPHARIRVRAGTVEFYFRTYEGREPHVELFQTELQNDNRRLATQSTNVVGQSSYKGKELTINQSEAAQGLFRLTIQQDLKAGEYAFVEKTSEGDVDLYVWDFGVDKLDPGVNVGPFYQQVPVK